MEDWCQCGGGVSTIDEAAKEGVGVFANFLWGGTEAVYPQDVSEDKALKWPLGM